MNTVPQIEPVTRMQRDHKELLAMTGNGPVILAQNSRAAAVLVSVEEWDRRAKRLDYLERLLLGDQGVTEVNAGNYKTVDEVDAGFQSMGIG